MSSLPQSLRQPMVFVDIETTGGSSKFARVLEIGAIRIEGGEVKRIYNTLLHPGSGISSWITELTGIRDQDVADAPQFHEIADELAEVLDGAIFVAHNVHFDYGFIRTEFDRLGVPFRPKMLCTVRLDRKLYPAQRRHNLASVIARLGIRPARRHRALDDAKVLWELCQRAANEIDHEAINEAITALIKNPSVPKELRSTLAKVSTSSSVAI